MAFTPVSTGLKLAMEPGTGLELILRTGSTPKKNLSVSENKTFAAKGSQAKRSIAMLFGTMNVSVSDYCMTSFVFQKIIPFTHKFVIPPQNQNKMAASINI